MNKSTKSGTTTGSRMRGLAAELSMAASVYAGLCAENGNSEKEQGRCKEQAHETSVHKDN
jgi:hypothetical protein